MKNTFSQDDLSTKPGIPVKVYLERLASQRRRFGTSRPIHSLLPPPKLLPYFWKKAKASSYWDDGDIWSGVSKVCKDQNFPLDHLDEYKRKSRSQENGEEGETELECKTWFQLTPPQKNKFSKKIIKGNFGAVEESRNFNPQKQKLKSKSRSSFLTSRGGTSRDPFGDGLRAASTIYSMSSIPSISSSSSSPSSSSLPAVPPDRCFVLLIGILYRNTVNELAGCLNDNEAVTKYFKFLGVPSSNIVQLSEFNSRPPTRSNIVAAMYQLMLQSPPNSKIFIFYSGHGGEIVDTTGTEASGKTQIIFPLNFEKDGIITDDEFFRMYNSTLSSKPTTSLFCFWDACHSGTFSDAPYQYIPNSSLTSLDFSYGSKQRETKALVKSIAAALDSQTAADDQTPGLKPHGAGTDALLYTLAQHTKTPLSHEQFLLTINLHLRKGKFTQRAQFTTTRKQNLKEVWSF